MLGIKGEEWLSTFCNDAARRHDVAGFREASIRIDAVDAANCLFAIDSGLVVDSGGGRYKAARSAAYEQLFWTDRRNKTPRPLTLWLEPVITFAALARLHRDHGWPPGLLATQPKGWAFDLVAHAPSNDASYQIAGEVRKSRPEIDRLLTDLKRLASGSDEGVKDNS